MRHGKKFNHLGRKAGHRRAMLRNMASSLIIHKRITTTAAKAKELRKYIEPVITKSKTDGIAARRLAFRYLQDKNAVHELFTAVSGKVAERNGGYTRIIKLGTRLGDNAETAIIELVDFNELYTQSKTKSTSKRRRRRGGKAAKPEAQVETQDTAVAEEEPVVEDVVTEEPVVEEPATEDAAVEETAEVVETVEEEPEAEEAQPEAEAVTDEADEEVATPDAESSTEIADEANAETDGADDSAEEEKKPEE